MPHVQIPVEGVIFDIDGVLEYQGKVFPGAVEIIQELKRRGVEIRYLTNSTLKSQASCAARLRRSGFPAEDHEAVTASFATAQFLRRLKPRSIWVLQDREGFGEFSDFTLDEDRPDYVVIGDGRSRFDFDHLNQALRMITQGAKLIGMTDELIDSSLGPLELNVGSWVRLLETAAGVQATCIGKPNPYAFEITLATMSVSREHVVMVGDRVRSDILGARRVGLRSVLVKTGEFRPEELTDDLQPDQAIDAIEALVTTLFPRGRA